MTGGLEAAADLASGAVVARAVSSNPPEPSDAPVHGACANCGTPLMGEFCYHCGQSAHLHRTVGAIGHEIAHGVFHFEGRIWHTLPLLAWRPGELTRRYARGQRARFVSPLALFLFSVFLMFATFHLVGSPFGEGDTHAVKQKARAAAPALTGNQRDAAEAALAKLENQRDAALASDPARAAKLEAGIARAKAALDVGAPDQSDIHFGVTPDPNRNIEVHLGIPWLDRMVQRAADNPDLLVYKLQADGYKFSWLLIPFSLPFIWLAFAWWRDVTLYDHAIFAIHSLSFMTLLMVVLSLIAAAGLTSLANVLLVLVPPVHIYRHLRGAYLLGRGGALWRTGWLVVSGCIALSAFFLVLLSMGLSD